MGDGLMRVSLQSPVGPVVVGDHLGTRLHSVPG